MFLKKKLIDFFRKNLTKNDEPLVIYTGFYVNEINAFLKKIVILIFNN